MANKIFGDKIVNQKGEKVTNIEDADVIGIYFSAHWCPPCRGFTPVLSEWYTEVKKTKKIEIVFVSCDQDDAAFKDYFSTMPWLAVDYSDEELREKLNTDYEVEGIPTLAFIDAKTGAQNKAIDGRDLVMAEKQSGKFEGKGLF